MTLALFSHFLAFFSDEEIPGTTATLATTFMSFGMGCSASFLLTCSTIFLRPSANVLQFSHVTVLNLAFALSVFGFLIMHVSLVSANTTTIEVLYSFEFYYGVIIVRTHVKLFIFGKKIQML